MSNGAWWVVRNFAVITAASAASAWAIIHWIFDPSPNLWVVWGWAVAIGLIGVWLDAAGINERRIDEGSSVLTPGHRNGRPQ